jgi:CheY-like chemotaxis protein
MRQVEAWLAAAGLIRAEPGRGTTVQTPVAPTVLLVTGEAVVEELLVENLARGGYCLVAAASPAEGLAVLGRDAAIALVLIDFGNLTPADGIKFIRRVRHRWPQIPLAVLVTETAVLTPLRGTPEWPLLIVPKPMQSRQLDELLRLTLLQGAPRKPAPREGGAT